eukprot:366508-Chlamydomonas_euryale.AAC.7
MWGGTGVRRARDSATLIRGMWQPLAKALFPPAAHVHASTPPHLHTCSARLVSSRCSSCCRSTSPTVRAAPPAPSPAPRPPVRPPPSTTTTGNALWRHRRSAPSSTLTRSTWRSVCGGRPAHSRALTCRMKPSGCGGKNIRPFISMSTS